MITAKEARELAGPTFDERVKDQLEFAYKEIKTAAENKKRKTVLRSDFWVRDGYSGTDEYKAAVKKLKDLGYTVEFFYEERQFVNMYTIVEW
jgi:lipid II:glycine glycyltransferase (peptidoglycan interpeptide bridge formation enzyme)